MASILFKSEHHLDSKLIYDEYFQKGFDTEKKQKLMKKHSLLHRNRLAISTAISSPKLKGKAGSTQSSWALPEFKMLKELSQDQIPFVQSKRGSLLTAPQTPQESNSGRKHKAQPQSMRERINDQKQRDWIKLKKLSKKLDMTAQDRRIGRIHARANVLTS